MIFEVFHLIIIDLVDYFQVILGAKVKVVSNDLRKGFDEVEDFKTNKIQLSDANDFLSELKSAY